MHKGNPKHAPSSRSTELPSPPTLRLDRENICAIGRLWSLREIRSLYLQRVRHGGDQSRKHPQLCLTLASAGFQTHTRSLGVPLDSARSPVLSQPYTLSVNLPWQCGDITAWGKPKVLPNSEEHVTPFSLSRTKLRRLRIWAVSPTCGMGSPCP